MIWIFYYSKYTMRGQTGGNRPGLDMGPGEGSSVLSSRNIAFVDQRW